MGPAEVGGGRAPGSGGWLDGARQSADPLAFGSFACKMGVLLALPDGQTLSDSYSC